MIKSWDLCYVGIYSTVTKLYTDTASHNSDSTSNKNKTQKVYFKKSHDSSYVPLNEI